jgi:pseudouridine-5'-monophosphatase
MGRLSAIVFDLDGLMVDTETISREAWKQLLKTLGSSLDQDTYHSIVGRRSDESALIMKNALNLPISPAELISRKSAIFYELLTEGVTVMPGLMELLTEIGKRNVPWAVATSSSRHYAEKILSQIGLSDSCYAIAAGDEVNRGKPAPDIYVLAARRLKFEPNFCIALEDSVPGCLSSIAAGMVTAAIPNKETIRDDFSFVHQVFQSLNDVAKNLDSLIEK